MCEYESLTRVRAWGESQNGSSLGVVMKKGRCKRGAAPARRLAASLPRADTCVLGLGLRACVLDLDFGLRVKSLGLSTQG